MKLGKNYEKNYELIFEEVNNKKSIILVNLTRGVFVRLFGSEVNKR